MNRQLNYYLSAKGRRALIMRKTPQAILDKMVIDYLAGATAKEAAAKHGKSANTCLLELRRRGIEAVPNGIRKRLNPSVVDAMVADYLSGMSSGKLAVKYDRDKKVCLGELKQRGIVPKCAPVTAQRVLDEMVSDYVSGMTTEEAAAKHGRNRSVCADEMKRRGIALRKHNAAERGKRISAGKQGISLSEWSGYKINPWDLFKGSIEYANWRNLVFRRDDFTCLDCRAKGIYLEAHHIFRKSIFPHMTLITENGVTLCKECHAKIRGHEEKHQARYLANIGSRIAPVVFYENRSDAGKDTSI